MFLEIGGFNGFTGSNSLSLEKHLNWKGVLVEPEPYFFKFMTKVRSKCKSINAVISPNDAKGKYQLRRAGDLSNIKGYEGFDSSKELRMSSSDFIEVKGVSATDILNKYNIDYFSLDVEGAEFEIINNIKWDKIYKPEILTIELNFNQEQKEMILLRLIKEGYNEIFASHEWLTNGDLWLVKR